jgi:hypothetical protein
MRYVEFRDLILKELKRNPKGFTWIELRDRLNLPYEKACQTWIYQLEEEIGLHRVIGEGRALVWKVRS